MKTTEYENLIVKIDKALARGGFYFKYKNYKKLKTMWKGTYYDAIWVTVKAVSRSEQFIVDTDGVSHSILGDQLNLPF